MHMSFFSMKLGVLVFLVGLTACAGQTSEEDSSARVSLGSPSLLADPPSPDRQWADPPGPDRPVTADPPGVHETADPPGARDPVAADPPGALESAIADPPGEFARKE
jgi:hypothetical protein